MGILTIDQRTLTQRNMSHWKAGQKIQQGRYVIDKVLGYGGAGVTYRALEYPSGNYVAIKTLNALMQGQDDFPKHQERFIQEAFCLAKCHHNHITRVYNVCQEDKLWCMVMEYIAGGNLRKYANYRKGLEEEEALSYIRQIGDALHYVHQQGFLHRDVKPANIMIRKQTMEAVLIDFGLARDFVQDREQTHTNSRTESYAPIEQYELRAKRGAYTDVYALAASLYYILTLQLPFPAIFRQQGAALIHPQQHNPDISHTVNDAIVKGMEFLPENRPQSIPEWLDLLNAPIVTVASPRSSRSTQMRRSHQVIVNPVRAEQMEKATKYQNTGRSNPNISTITASSLDMTIQTTNEDDLQFISAVGVDYRSLAQLLTEGKWQEADQQTGKLMLQAVQREASGWLDEVHIETFPCEDFRTLDQLWIKYSSGRFGFSVQKQIYRSLGGSNHYDAEIWRSFAEKVGWRTPSGWQSYKKLDFSLTAPEGHLPMLGMSFWGFRGWIMAISDRLDHCQITRGSTG